MAKERVAQFTYHRDDGEREAEAGLVAGRKESKTFSHINDLFLGGILLCNRLHS